MPLSTIDCRDIMFSDCLSVCPSVCPFVDLFFIGIFSLQSVEGFQTKLARNIHHMSGKSIEGFQGGRAKVNVVGVPFMGTLFAYILSGIVKPCEFSFV